MENKQKNEKILTELRRGKEQEEQVLSNGFNEYYGMLYVMGASYEKGYISRINIVAYYFVMMTHIPFLFVTALVSDDDLGLRFESAHWFMMLTNALFASMILIRHRKCLDRIFTVMGRQFHHYGPTIDDETQTEIDRLVEESEKWRHFIVKSFIVSVAATGGFLTTARSAYDMISGRLWEPRKENGIIPCIPVFMWYPFDLFGGFKIILIIIEYYIILITAFIILALDLGFVTQAHTVNSQFEILAITLRNFERRAKHLFFARRPSKSKKINDDYKETPLFRKCITACINESVKHHQLLIRFCRDLYTYSYISVMAIIFVSTLLICISAYVFSADVSFMVKFTFFCFLLTEMVHCYLYCWYSQQILDAHDKLIFSLYSANWIDYTKVVRPYWAIIQARCNVALGISAGGVQVVSLSVFINVLRSAFSYYSVLQTNKFKGKTALE